MYRNTCKEQSVKPEYEAGVHYVATPAERRILLPDLPALRGLRHRWCWEGRPRPYLPTWSFAKVPRPDFSPEENARLLSVYLRPWTLNPTESTANNPLLSVLGKCHTIGDRVVPAWTRLRPSTASTEAPGAEPACGSPGAAHDAPAGQPGTSSSGAAQDAPGPDGQPNKRRRLRGKLGPSSDAAQERHSYAASWEAYIEGNIVSETSRRFITNLLAGTAASKTEHSDDSSEDSL